MRWNAAVMHVSSWHRFSVPRAIVLGSCLALSVAGRPSRAPAAGKIIMVKAGSDFNVTTNDMLRFRELAGGVGRGFEPRAEMDEALRTIEIKRIRCINVCPLGREVRRKQPIPVRSQRALLRQAAESLLSRRAPDGVAATIRCRREW